MRKLKMMVAALVCLGAMGASASRNITEEVRLAGKASFSLVQGELVSGSSLANAFDGQTGWAKPCAQFVTLPTEAEPVVFDYIIADDFDDGQAFVASRIVLYGLNNYYDAARNPTFMDIYGSSDGGENWTLLYDDDWGCTFHGNGLYMNYWIPAEKRGAYRRFRFVVRGNFGSTSVTSPLAIMDIRVHQDVVWYVDPDGDDTTHSGTNGWDDAITITNAIVQGATFDEIHLKQGTHPVLKAMSHAKLFAILGGYLGDTANPYGLAAEPMSVLDAQGTVGNIFQLTYNPGNYTAGHFQFYQNVEFARATSSAVNSGSGYYWSHDFRNCRFTDCRSSSGGRGIYHKGDYQRTRSLVMLHDCVFSGNGLTDGAGVAWDGAGVYLYFGRLRAFNCRFEENGLSPTAAPAGNGGKTVNGAAIMARYAGLNVKDTVFVHNRSSAGAAVYGYETSGGYTLDRCAFIGNESVAAASTASGSSAGLALNLASETSPVHVRNCTFAYNIADDATGAAALTVQCGTANVTNCIFSGNIVGASCTVGADVALKSTGYLNMDYCLATDEGTVTATDALRLALGSNMVYGDARFVTSEATVKGWVVSSGGNVGIPVSDRYVYFDPTYAEAIKGIDVHLLSSAGYRKNGDATWHTDAGVSSPAIDAGDPASDYANEPQPNGHRVNLGFYGNTPYATMTPLKGTLIFFK